MKKYIAEIFGTFALALIVVLSVTLSPSVTPLIAAITLGLFVYTIGSISGAHLNPAVTVGLWSIGKVSKKEAGKYIVAQSIGMLLAYFLSKNIGLNNPVFAMSMSTPAFLAEVIGTMFFTFGIASVVYGKVQDVVSGIVIGGSLLLGILFAVYLGSNGVLNPAVAFVISSFSWAYVLGPVFGSIVGFNLYSYLNK